MTLKRGESAVEAYNELVAAIPTGGFYLEELCRIPFRNKTTDFLYKAAKVNTVYGIYVNDIFFGESKSNWEGWVSFRLLLPRGECRIRVLDSTSATGILTAELVHAFYLTWVGGLADALGDADTQAVRVYDSRSIERVSSDDIQTNFGDFLQCPRVTTFTLDVYRELLQEVIQCFRYWSATPEGLENVIAAFSQVRPLRKTMRKDIARWVLGYQHLLNREMTERFRYVVTTIPSTGIIPVACSDSNTIGTAQLFYDATALTLQFRAVTDLPFGPPVPVVSGFTYTLTADNGVDTVTVETQGVLPAANIAIPINVTGPASPNTTVIENATAYIVGNALMQISGKRLFLEGTGAGNTAITLYAAPTIHDHLGEVFDASFWIQQITGGNLDFVVEISEDGGPWMTSAVQTVPSSANYMRVQYQTSIGFFGTSEVRVRLRCVAGATQEFYVEKAALHSPQTGALYLGHNTIPRTRRRKFFGQQLLIFNIEAIERQAYEILGIRPRLGWGGDPWGVDPYGSPSYGYLRAMLFGLTQYIIPTYVELYFFQNTLNASDNSGIVNVKGIVYESDWRTGTRVNLNVVPRSPDRFSHMVPTTSTRKAELVVFDSFGVATLTEPSLGNATLSLLLRNGVPMPNSTWSYMTNSTIQLANLSELDPTATYEFRYTVEISYLSAVVDCGIKYYLFNWYADWYEYIRCGLDAVLNDRTEALDISPNTLQATLTFRAQTTSTTNEVYMNDSRTVTKLSTTQWRFIDPLTIKVEPEVFSTSNTYTIVYTSRGLVKRQIPQIVVEVRYSADNLTWSPWIEIPHDAPFGNRFRYFQFRVNIDNVTDLRDYKLRSLVMKGDPLDRSTIESLV
jgi:hypothetical protein